MSLRITAAVLLLSPVVAVAQCPGDLDGNGTIENADLGAFLALWGGAQGGAADLDGDGLVDGRDLSRLLTSWGSCQPTPPWAALIELEPDPAIVTDPALRSAIIATGWAWRVRDVATQIEMVLIPPGTYQRGCTPSVQFACVLIESPVHQVTITHPFYMSRTEVTQAQWSSTMGSNPSFFQGASYPDAAQRPVERVSWDTVQGFLTAASMRLPSEGEWEFACRAGTTTAFHGSAALPGGTSDDTQVAQIAWTTGNSASQTHAVAGKAANGFGLHDMSGNVTEWVGDFFGQYSSAPQVNPFDASGISKNVRGGSWQNTTNNSRSSYRNYYQPTVSSSLIGFRVARNP